MAVQASTEFNSVSLKIRGELRSEYPLTIEQDAGRSGDLLKWTVLGKKTLAVPTTGVAGANTGDGTVTLVSKDPYQSPQVGAYNLECVTAVANGGVFKLEDPGGNLITNTLTMTVGAGAATEFTAGGLIFTITDGATDFIVGDSFTITTTANGKYVPLNPVATDGSEAFAGIFNDCDIAAASIVAGDVSAQIITGGDGAVLNEEALTVETGTLATVLPSGKTLKEEMLDAGLFIAATEENYRGEN